MTPNLQIARSKSGGWQPLRSPKQDGPQTGKRDLVGGKTEFGEVPRAEVGKRKAGI